MSKKIPILLRFQWVTLLMLYLGLFFSQNLAASPEVLEVGSFSKGQPGQQIPSGWQELKFDNIKKRTSYRLVSDSGRMALQAVSDGSASGLFKKIKINPKEFPFIRWSWKVSNVYEKGDGRIKGGDDYPARIYFTFGHDPSQVSILQKTKLELIKALYGQYPPLATINYIWASKLKTGQILPRPYAEESMMVAVESGSSKIGRWFSYTRNILEDYKKIYGKDPFFITGVAIMTDSDDTQEIATCWYGDITFLKSNPSQKITQSRQLVER